VDKQDKKINAGVYALICLWTGFAYVGASRQLLKRFQRHLDLLRLNRHPCKSLQEQWNEFGPDCFAVFPLELIQDNAKLCARERAWTKKCFIECKVFNQRNAITDRHRREFGKCKPKWPEKPIGASAKQYCFISPTGEVMKVRGLRGICSAYNLNPSHLSKVNRGIFVQHRGWTSGKTEEEILKN
jgi:hypothetical protein